mgnify:CR=1 FL=1
MRLLALEIKRVLKTKRTWILIVASVLLAVFMAYIPITFVTVQKTDESGNYVEITGNRIHPKSEINSGTICKGNQP